jgi:hypothetical protein
VDKKPALATVHNTTFDPITHKTGYLCTWDGVQGDTMATWHRTLRGALRPYQRTDHTGEVHRILSDDHTERVLV